MIREFTLTNASGVDWSLNRPDYCFLNEPQGLGFAVDGIYNRLGNKWVAAEELPRQMQITGEVIFTDSDPYTAYKAFGRFLKDAPLVLTYTTNAGTFYRDVSAASLGKTEIKEGFLLRCPLTLNCTSLWYGLTFAQQLGEPAVLCETDWDQLTDANGDHLITNEPDWSVLNDGDVDAPFTLSVNGLVSNPTMTIIGPDGTVTTVTFPVSLAVSDTLLYSSVDGDLYCIKDSGGVETNLVPSFAVNATIFAKVPAGLSTITIPGSNVQIQFRKEYMAV